MKVRPSANGTHDREAAAAYVAELSGELARLARRHGLDALGYLLEMARLEAQMAAGQQVGRATEHQDQ